MSARLVLALAALAGALASLSVQLDDPRPTLAPYVPPAHCVAINDLPDPRCTPGAINHAVTQRTIGGTICAQGWASSVRPPEVATERIKAQDVRRYGAYAGTSLRGYEEDHLIPIELGGALLDRRNLWPEAHPASYAKDRREDALRRGVCAGAVSLRAARASIRRAP